MSSLGHNLGVLFYGKATFHSRYILFYIISNISINSISLKSYDVMMSIGALWNISFESIIS